MKLFEMEGFLRGKCIPRDLKVNETNAEYLVRKFAEADAMCAALAAEKEKFAVECAATKIAIAYLKSGRHDFTLNTPATDAFLAEVRASALEYYANLFKDTVNMDVKHNQEFHKGTLYVADQFRKGASQ
ncbi:TPA: hypothetical protein RK151_004132 [Enterobacter hormaechei subsp. hoffmannii]|uniref:hypothetical protein n=1 Tax=Enterobacter kobei TaxID=208224 RepID=UPI00277D0442|nr:hypothetical protein [Enterobacter kobei]HDS5006149.1 hypothetical protein [Enterobacter hormaechei subsp. hoffmannii]MEB7605326.1 hypothetical protein [Enterobacter kobei]HDV9010914.1 hypothetical protein [Enterobacter hormaechei subsp. hoffmannii]HDW1110826.1 hypothetical protein [Enterobacter hormaechei subsp. hoffmannii]HEP0683723.1 hypothetical protein [Enterobacter hormaechei subsp. hoffmannii]